MEPKQVRCGRAVSLILGMVLALSVFSSLVFAQTSPMAPVNQPTGLKLPVARSAEPNAATRARVIDTYGKLPLRFEANRGQTDSRVKFLARGAGYSLFLTGDEAVLSLRQAEAGQQKAAGRDGIPNSKTGPRHSPRVTARPSGTTQSVVRMKLIGANSQATVTGLAELPGKSNYFIGNDPKKWRTDVPNYAQVRYQGVYPGIDLVYYGNQGQLEYDFVVAPGADPRAITLDVGAGLAPPTIAAVSDRRPAVGTPPHHPSAQPAAPLRLAANGDLVLRLNGGEIRFHKPVVYQDVDTDMLRALAPLTHRYAVPPLPASGERAGVRGLAPLRHYLDGRYVLMAGNQVSFQVGAFDKAEPLIIDPVLTYSSYLGGSNIDEGDGIAVDGMGNAYLTGLTSSPNFPIVNQIPGACNGTCGETGSSSVAFVTKVDAAGNALVYSSFIGGSGGNGGSGIAVDGSGSVYLTGGTGSADFPIVNQIPGACNGTCGNGNTGDAFVTKINPAGSALVYSSYVGGSSHDDGTAIGVDDSGNAYVTGYTNSTDFPRVNQIPGACKGTCGSGSNYVAFVTKINAAGSALVYSSYLGGSTFDQGIGIAVDASGNAYLTGNTQSPDFPVVNQISGACNGYCGDGYYPDAFVTKINAAGSALVYSSLIGGTGSNGGKGIVVDGSGNAYVTGDTDSPDFPIVNWISGACQGMCGGGNGDAFVTEINVAGDALVHSGYLGGSGPDVGFGIAVDGSGDVYVTGQTGSTDFPRLNQIPGACNGTCGTAYNTDAFVTKISPSPFVNLSPASLVFGPQGVQAPNFPQTVTLTSTGELPLLITNIDITGTNGGDFTQTNDCPISPNTLAPGDYCTITVVFAPTGPGTLNADVTLTDNAPNSPQNVSLTGVGVSGKPGLAGPQSAKQTAKPGHP